LPHALIPDVNFEKKLIAPGIDSGNGRSKLVSINKITSLSVYSSSIHLFNGIQDFVAFKKTLILL
jgi:hypothetical protein